MHQLPTTATRPSTQASERAVTGEVQVPTVHQQLDASHRTWCETPSCDTREDGNVEHAGTATTITIADAATVYGLPLQVTVQLCQDPDYSAPSLHLTSADGEGTALNADAVAQAAAQAEALAAELRRRHRQMTGTSVLTDAQRTLTLDEGLGSHRTTPIESTLRDISCDTDYPDDPWLSAEMVITDYRPQAHGRRTKIWLRTGAETAELTPQEARQAVAAAREFAPRLEALIALAEESSAGDFEGDPEIAAADREAEDRRIKAITEGRA
ncbi:hypothetical protein ABZ439_11420 [Streptomyces sp. NPDC005840]|uniref:DUF6907 domain-containing protein n=1 Tax=Streptomyces sp. NPDC005840 TaxID=3157072 RepID=UPI0033D7AA7E